MIRIVNAELADGLGNLVSRSSGKALNPAQIRPALLPSSFEQVGPLGADLLTLLNRVPDDVRQFYSQWKFYKYYARFLFCNSYVVIKQQF